eukprot:5919703-Prymnesium_polylepis.1
MCQLVHVISSVQLPREAVILECDQVHTGRGGGAADTGTQHTFRSVKLMCFGSSSTLFSFRLLRSLLAPPLVPPFSDTCQKGVGRGRRKITRVSRSGGGGDQWRWLPAAHGGGAAAWVWAATREVETAATVTVGVVAATTAEAAV